MAESITKLVIYDHDECSNLKTTTLQDNLSVHYDLILLDDNVKFWNIVLPKKCARIEVLR